MTTALPLRPAFIETDQATIVNDMVTDFEASSAKALQPAQVERLMINAYAYREGLVRMGVQLAAEQNLVAFATEERLDALAGNLGVTRLVDKHATCTIRFTLATVLGTDTTIPAATRVRSTNEVVTFTPNVDGTILAGQSYADIPCTCTVGGEIGNGYTAGQVSVLLDPIAGVTSAANTTTTDGGVDTESDDALRERVRLAPYAYGSAGSKNGYKFHALSVGPEIVDAYVTSPAGGEVQVAILTISGAPTVGQLAAVTAALSAETVRPLTDTVTVVSAVALPYTIEATLTVYDTADQASVLATAIAAAEALAALRRRTLGADITGAQVSAALFVPGVYDMTLVEPVPSVTAAVDEFCNCTAISITIAGTSGG
jgi:phage-related baseplate assembly protein